uniref:Innexin n=1 Tax=Meloidogyne hapla TaxID=6305 RepID=A0A1I8BJI3_MELHA
MTASVLLALNRCMDILCSELTQMLFEGNRVWIWLGATTIYGFYWLFFVVRISPFIFLCINRTIRNDCILLFYKIFDPSRVTQVHGVTVLRSDGGGALPPSGSQRSAAVTKVSPGLLPQVGNIVTNRERERF